jgi:serine O-acetyltransferase
MSKLKAQPLNDGSKNENPRELKFWQLIKEDYKTHDSELFNQGFIALFTNRFGNKRMDFKPKIFRVPFSLLYIFMRKFCQIFCGIKLDYTVIVGRRVKFEHFGGMIIGAREIKSDVIIRQNTTIGIKNLKDLNAKPTICENVQIGAGAVIVGDIVIGKNTLIGANTVISTNIPENSVVKTAVNISVGNENFPTS